jgi:phosphoribosylformimino-5-aminoimidazole carboxamide ribotide isomerase
MEIIPVMDILNGIVVHAVRGEREKYKPIKSILSASPDPVEIANAFKKILNLKNYTLRI